MKSRQIMKARLERKKVKSREIYMDDIEEIGRKKWDGCNGIEEGLLVIGETGRYGSRQFRLCEI